MGFYKTTLPKNTYSSIYIDKIHDYCISHCIPSNNKMVKSIVLWMIKNNYIESWNDEDLEHDVSTIFKIMRWEIEEIIDAKRPYDPHIMMKPMDWERLRDTFIRQDNGIYILPGINCTKGEHGIIEERFDDNLKMLKTIFSECGFEFKRRGSKFKGQAYIYDIKKKI